MEVHRVQISAEQDGAGQKAAAKLATCCAELARLSLRLEGSPGGTEVQTAIALRHGTTVLGGMLSCVVRLP